MGYFSSREEMEYLLRLRHQLLKTMMRKDQRLKMDVQMFLRRKNEVVRELYLTLEILAATFGVEMEHLMLRQVGFISVFMLVLMPLAMPARLRRIGKASQKMVVFGAIMELHVPTH